jgi:imidazolonepropionase-like amidohydrolase
VDCWAKRGVTSIKIKQSTAEETRILIDQAHKNGMTATGHLANYDDVYDVHPRDAIAMKIDRVEHWITLEEGGEEKSELKEMIALFLKHKIYFDANLQMYGEGKLRHHTGLDMVWTDESRFFTPYARELLKKRIIADPSINYGTNSDFPQRVLEFKAFYGAGGGPLILVGTDEPVYNLLLPAFAYHRELMAMVWAGMPPVAVLKAATINGARALGVDDQLGSIEPGKLADLFIANGNPLEDITAARRIRMVIKEGVIHRPADLFAAAENKIGPSGPDDHEDWKLRIVPPKRRK